MDTSFVSFCGERDWKQMIPDEAAKSVRHATLRVKELEAHITRTRAALICAFNQMLDLKDLNTGCHSTRLAEWGVRVASDLGADEPSMPDFERASLFVLHHHERWDGGGYPAGLAGPEIPLPARIVSVIDAFDAMTSNRPYRSGLPFEEAVRRLLLSKHTQFDPEVVDCFV